LAFSVAELAKACILDWTATLIDMATEMVFGGGHRVRVATTNAEGLTLTLNRPKQGQGIRTARGSTLPPGWIEVETEDEGVILVNPASVAYVRDVEDMPQVEETARNLSDLEPRQVRGTP
jgi:hypothetical protein